MSKKLVIVESPAKSKTIQKYLGKDYEILASYGHVRDLSKDNMGIQVDNGFEPDYLTMKDKKTVIKDLKKMAKTCDHVYIATDPDREGEAIAWHLVEAMKLKGIPISRIVFNEITQSAVKHAIENPRELNMDLVNAQQARRILDRLLGFEMSPLLWKKIKMGLSAGRVQSVSVRLIAEREAEIKAFEPVSSFRVQGEFETEEGAVLSAERPKKCATKEEAQSCLESCQKQEFKVNQIERKEGKRSPSPPFTTSSLQQEASRKLGYSVSRTMTLAQRLYEAGHITYMRTDSFHLSEDAIQSMSAHIQSEYGKEYSKPTHYKTKAKGAQEAHEAIRPASISVAKAGKDDGEKRLYDLIRKRALASQMSPAKVDRTIITLGEGEHAFQSKGEIITFHGFLKVYGDMSNTETFLPDVKEGESLAIKAITATENFSKPPARYTEASLVKRMEELGIGRPSTYAPTISTIQKRDYVRKEEREGKERPFQVLTLENDVITASTKTERTGVEKGKLFPTDIGTVVNNFLVEKFADIMAYDFTASIEGEFDEIATGSREWRGMIDGFYQKFHPTVVELEESKERAAGERLLGQDSKGVNVYVKIGRYGPVAQIGETTDEEKPRFAGLLKEQSITDITLEQALKLFDLPRDVGEFEGEKVIAAIGRFGPYVKYKSLFVSLKEDDPLTIEIDKAVTLIKEKIEIEKNKVIQVFEEHDPPVRVLNGRFGPYIAIGKQNVKIPKDQDPKALTLEACLELQKTAKPSKRRGGKKR